ncbi:MAG: hypothetical protein Q4D62_07390 [Planctomycetia bacterium]|nr:hypothetical protein [Planctomycetia bacterium]
MKRFFCLLLLLCGMFPACAFGKEMSFVRQLRLPEGQNVLCVEYPCDAHPNTSLEIRVLDKETLKNPRLCKPIYFQSDKMMLLNDLDVCVNDEFNACYLGDEKDMLKRKMELQKANLLFLGWESALGPREAAVLYEQTNERTGNVEKTWIFPDATHVSLGKAPTKRTPYDSRMFVYELLPPEFDKPCDLQIWLLRGSEVLFSEKFRWEGR